VKDEGGPLPAIAARVTAATFVNMYWMVPRLTCGQSCDADDPPACGQASRISKVLLWTWQLTGFVSVSGHPAFL
jgi:hypothetical protein